MSLEPIGLATLVLGLLCLLASPSFSIAALIPATLLGSAAAVVIGSGGNIQPAHMLLGFVAPAVLTRRGPMAACVRSLRFPNEGFWLVALAAFGVAGAFLLPRVLEGSTQINAIGNTEYGPAVQLVPLSPVSGNVTQSIYLVADVVCFLVVNAASSSTEGFRSTARILVAYTVANIAFAALDMGTYFTGTTYLLEFMRNAQYTFHLDEFTGGLKRIAGSFTETSSFAYASLGALGFVGTLAVSGRWPRVTAPLAIVSTVLLVLSTSSTAFAGLPVVLACIYGVALLRATRPVGGRVARALAIGGPPAAVALVAAVALDDTARTTVREYLDILVFEKANSQSGIERASWNAAAMQNFVDTWGLGGGLGSIRASSFLLAVPSNLGVIGVALFGTFLVALFLRQSGRRGTFETDVRTAARVACLGVLTAASVSGALVDLGLAFFAIAGLACARPEPSTQPVRAHLVPAREPHASESRP